jgi:hypothetical protein
MPAWPRFFLTRWKPAPKVNLAQSLSKRLGSSVNQSMSVHFTRFATVVHHSRTDDSSTVLDVDSRRLLA